MKLSLESLRGVGAFTGRPVEKEIRWQQGKEEIVATVYVRPLGFQTAVNDVLSAAGRLEIHAGRIAASICNEEGKPVFTVDDITGDADPERGALDGNLTMALMKAIAEVNNLGKTKPSPTTKSSGTSSSSPASAGVRSRKPRKTSA
ncbi:phage tail assembly chaperone family protein, TAC [Pseudomonas syringae]|uniref:phage tail assembly chaperone family protein, TAC n=1 Tax=Pseudomonas syringae TaxID=317 RepID=UPI0018E5C463|nr:phage tail assembly chaperone family protein, TAC [Pseudomonas syringae]MBI6780511.1 phage tail assembly chaperone family protein, TAC [Pseudomonas syringae]